MNSPLLLLPLDDRPINLEFPPLLARVAGERLLAPSVAHLGRFMMPGDPARLAEWLAAEAERCRAAIISLDMLAYGGLVASRMPDTPESEALDRLRVLREIKRRRPDMRLLAFSVIMRLTITAADPDTRAAGRDIFRYSVLRDRMERLGEMEVDAELREVEARVPPAILERYLRARARNHAVNRMAVELLGDGVLDFLALVQEDTAPAGLHVREQERLLALARERAPEGRWRVYPGTDEAAQTLLARLLLEEAGLAFPVSIRLRDAAAAAHPALFEDRPLRDSVRQHVDAAGGAASADGLALAVNTFTPPQPDLFEMAPLPHPTWDAALRAFPSRQQANWPASVGTLPLAVADVAYCNGGDPHLLDALLVDGRYPELAAYAGWNTAGNTLGTTLAHAAVWTIGRQRGMTPEMLAAHREALFIRLLDDGLYQSVVRGWAMARVEDSGLSPLNLGERAAEFEPVVHGAMQHLWGEMRERYPCLTLLDRPFRAELPWSRLFETRIVVTG